MMALPFLRKPGLCSQERELRVRPTSVYPKQHVQTNSSQDSLVILSFRTNPIKAMYSSIGSVTLRVLGLGGPLGEELLRGLVAKGLVGADGVVGPLPVEQFLIGLGDLERAVGNLIELPRGGALGALNRAAEFGV
jgi:hypothetical protein